MLNVNTLNNIRDQKEINRYQIYNKVLMKVHHRIKVVSKKGESNCFYIIPEFIYGIPKYDTLNCADFLVNRLKKNGFNVIYTFPNLIFISWEHIPSQYKKRLTKKKEIEQSKSIEKEQKKKKEYRLIDDYRLSRNFFNKIS